MNIDKPLLKSLLIMADIIEARDPYTGGHVWRVSQFAKLLTHPPLHATCNCIFAPMSKTYQSKPEQQRCW